MTLWKIAVLVTLIAYVAARPGDSSFSASANIQTNHKPLISFENGRIGVNFAGYHAAAGLGGLLTGNVADGGLHAEAGTPWGPAAAAGLGGNVFGEGRAAGGLYAGATAGHGVSAAAGLEGATNAESSYGKSYAGASNGQSETHITKIKGPTKVFSSSFTASASAPSSFNKEIEIIKEQHQPAPVKTTYIEKTVIPNYQKKIVQVPSYVEKTVRVPTVVEKEVWVPAAPTVVEKTVNAPDIDTRGAFSAGGAVNVEKVHPRPFFHKRLSYYGNGYGDGSGEGGASGSGSFSATVSKHPNPQFFNDIFNIPISALTAVNKLVSGIAGGTSGSLSVQKSYGVTKK